MFSNVFFNSKQHLSKTLFDSSTPSVVILMIYVTPKYEFLSDIKKKSQNVYGSQKELVELVY